MSELPEVVPDALLARLREVFDQADPVPASVMTAAKASFTWRTVDAELAELVADSALEPLAAVRSVSTARLLTFETEDLTVVLEVATLGATCRLLGQVIPARPARIEVRHLQGRLAAHTDELGRFVFDAVPAGPISLVCDFQDGSGRSLTTSWVAI